MRPRARDLGFPCDGTPGPLNAITDVPGVAVGHTTLIEGAGPLRVGHGPVRTGVTVVLPRGARYDPVFAGWHALNGNGEMTGTAWIDEAGFLEGPIALTNTHSVGVVRDAVVAWQIEKGLFDAIVPGVFWVMPVVAETYDGGLNDINGFHVRREHVFAALDGAAPGPVAEGGVGGGTGMVCYGFKGGIGTASRQVPDVSGAPTVGVLVQANHGSRAGLTIGGVPVGRELADVPTPYGPPPAAPEGTGSIIVVVATDAPLLPHQLRRLARRVSMGVARGGTAGEHYSGDLFIAFSVANPGSAARAGIRPVQMLSNDEMTPLFAATVQATEEAVLNALAAAETMTGRDGRTAHALPHERVRAILQRHGRLGSP
jgi:D-aminopeptidase